MLIRDFKDTETALALRRVCRYLIDYGWHHEGDDDEWGAELRLAVARSRRHKKDVKMLSELDMDLSWGQTKQKTGEKTYIITGGGDFNPWYTGDLTLKQLLDSLSDLVDILGSMTPEGMIEAEFLHFYNFLRLKLIVPSSLKKAPVSSITFESLHPKIKTHCKSRFENKSYSDAIFTAYKVIFNELKEITGIRNLDGKKLAEAIFSGERPVIKLNDLESESDRDEQNGFMLLVSGAALGVRNPKAHDLIEQDNPIKTLEYLSFASLLLTRIDERKALDLTAIKKKISHKAQKDSSSTSKYSEPPYVYIQGSFGGNGHIMKFAACVTYNLSDQFIFIEKIQVIDAIIPFSNTLVKAGESLQHTGIDGLSYPISEDPKQTIKIYFHARNKEKFVSIQRLKFQKRADGKFNIIDIDEPIVHRVKD